MTQRNANPAARPLRGYTEGAGLISGNGLVHERIRAALIAQPPLTTSTWPASAQSTSSRSGEAP
ncbi:MAG: hypothetical protein ACRDPW_08255 [Mycobacteriales bacterium]